MPPGAGWSVVMSESLFDMTPVEDREHVRPDDGRCAVCGYAASMCSGVPAAVLERMRRFIEGYGSRVGWRFAKTMADIPHSYAVRKEAAKLRFFRDVPSALGESMASVETSGDDEFAWFAEAIRQYGYTRRWTPKGKAFKYVNVDGWRYWTMGNPIPETTILNRAPISREGREELRRENGYRNLRFFTCARGHEFAIIVETFEVVDANCPACLDHVEVQPSERMGV